MCECACTPKPVIEDQSRNGIRVLVHRFPDGSTYVDADCKCFDADCKCFGYANRCHSVPNCPARKS